MNKSIFKNHFFILSIVFIFLSCSSDDENLINEKIIVSASEISSNSVNINYQTEGTNQDKFLICSQSENFDFENFDFEIQLSNNNGNIKVLGLLPNKEYFFKIYYSSNSEIKYSNQIKVSTNEIVFTTLINQSIDISSSGYLRLRDSSIDHTQNNIYLIVEASGGIDLIKIDINGNVIWRKNIQSFISFSWFFISDGHKIQVLSDGNVLVITSNQDRDGIIINLITPSGELIKTEETELLITQPDITGIDYSNNTLKLLFGAGGIYHDSEEMIINNEGNVINQRVIASNVSSAWFQNMRYIDDNTLINVGYFDKIPNDGLVTYEGLFEKLSISNGTYTSAIMDFHGIYGGDDRFDQIFLNENHIYVNGYFGNESGFSEDQKWVVKFDYTGNIIWEHKSPIQENFIYQAKDIIVDQNNYVFSLMHEIYYPNSNVYDITTLSKFDNDGNLIWTFKDGDEFNDERFTSHRVYELSNKEYLITGDNSSGNGSVWIKRIKAE
ncbi:hypothetical protein ACFSX9_00600 [Flavobacterium ardleyense]|uniref:Fibronectin type-III domain-containing protein n=1 Tax=Flavobacterium ardleyense TaxID=2038737 RepID=A0ABW5Z474_9FLAO